jgi:hypothetical protein
MSGAGVRRLRGGCGSGIVVARRGRERLRIAGRPARPVRAPDRRQARGPRRRSARLASVAGAALRRRSTGADAADAACARALGTTGGGSAVKPAATVTGFVASPITGALTGSVADAAAATAAASFFGFWRSTR